MHFLLDSKSLIGGLQFSEMQLCENCCLWDGLAFCRMKWANLKPAWLMKITGHTCRGVDALNVFLHLWVLLLLREPWKAWDVPAYKCCDWGQGSGNSLEVTKPGSGTSGSVGREVGMEVLVRSQHADVLGHRVSLSVISLLSVNEGLHRTSAAWGSEAHKGLV